jgi:hypothetical protein
VVSHIVGGRDGVGSVLRRNPDGCKRKGNQVQP